MRFPRLSLTLLCVLPLVGCTKASPSTAECAGGKREVVVFAASSLSSAFESLKNDLIERAACVSKLTFQFGSSGALAAQIVSGSPADIFVSAGAAATKTVTDGLTTVDDPVEYVRNMGALMLNTQNSEANKVTKFADMFPADETRVLNLKVGVCVASAPCGAMADEIMANLTKMWLINGNRLNFATTETTSVGDLVTKVSLGELDAGLVYASDCSRNTPNTRCLPIADDINVTTSYSAMSLNSHTATAQIMNALVSDTTRTTLVSRFGFLPLG